MIFDHSLSVSAAEPVTNVADAQRQRMVSLDLDEKIALLNGHGMWRTTPIPRLGVPSVTMTDGTHGVRLSQGQLAEDAKPDVALVDFLAMVGSGNTEKADFGISEPSTCYPAACTYGCSWDVELARELGRHLAIECRAMGIDLLLGPGANLRRTPFAGRGYEYYSEDPILTGEMAGAVIMGLQENGVGAVLKHFACNESEIDRTRMNSLVSPRALREIYLKAFERAIERGRPWAVMSAYNLLNGEQAAENRWLLTQVLRKEWDFEGVVMSDWHGIKDRPASLQAGNDLDMPQSLDRRRQLRGAIGGSPELAAAIDQSCRRVLKLVDHVEAGRTITPTDQCSDHHALARKMAEESIVLLKNEKSLLPLSASVPASFALIGPSVKRPLIQGFGSSTINPSRVDDVIEEFNAVCAPGSTTPYFPGWAEDPTERARLIEEAVAGAAAADVALVFVNVPEDDRGGEETDRSHLCLAEGQDELVARIAEVQPNTVVVLFAPDAVLLPWIEKVPALLAPFFAGQGMANALARLVIGVANPSGKLTTSFPARVEDLPAFPYHPGDDRTLWYGEDILPGYRTFDRKRIEPLFAFGHGLSYTRFEYSDLTLDQADIEGEEVITASFTLSNVGEWDGHEICQLYTSWPQAAGNDPVRELKGFHKAYLHSGEATKVEISIRASDCRHWRSSDSTAQSGWVYRQGPLLIEVGSSSRSLHLAQSISSLRKQPERPALNLFSLPKEVLSGDEECRMMKSFLADYLGLSQDEAGAFLPVLKNSFLGIATTLQWFAGDLVQTQDVSDLIARINEAPLHRAEDAA